MSQEVSPAATEVTTSRTPHAPGRNSPRLSVIIPTYMRPKKLATTIACYQRQTLSPDTYEIIVVDDASTPPAVISETPGRAPCSLIRFDTMVERSVARNTAVEAARGEIVLFSDDDLEVGGDFLEAHLRAQDEWHGALVVGKIILPPDSLTHPAIRFRQRLEHSGLPATRGLVDQRNFCTAANMSISRPRYQELGGFDLDLVGIEDQDFAVRHTATGGKTVFLPEAVAVHNDDWLDFPSFCRRQEWASECTVALGRRYPNLVENGERDRVNGPIRWGRETVIDTARKMVKSTLASRPVMAGMFKTVAMIERISPESPALERAYRLLLGIHLLRGYRKGLRRGTSPADP